MCDYFYQRMENSQGDLTDIIRSHSLMNPTHPANDSSAAANRWQFLHEQAPEFPRLDDRVLGAGPLLHETSFFDSSENSASGSLFSRMPQISLGKGKGPPVIGAPSVLSAGGGGGGGGGAAEISSTRLMAAGTKRRKSQAKKVVCIPAPSAASGRPSGEVVPSDLWAWRKYGQKPIKGSPYPRGYYRCSSSKGHSLRKKWKESKQIRTYWSSPTNRATQFDQKGYYRCSSSKGCSARKQVERSRTDPNMLVITYTSEHNHPWPTQRNALAGSTRSQPSKTNNSSSTTKNSPHHNNHKQYTTIKEEPKECSSSNAPLQVKEEAHDEMEKTLIDHQDHHDFNSVFDESFNEHMMSNLNQPDNFFADLEELDPDPMNLIFPKGFMGYKLDEERNNNNNNKAVDPFNMLDWGEGNMFGESKRGL